MTKTSLCLISVAAFLAFAGCQGSHSDNAATPNDISAMDVNSNIPFQGQPASAQQIEEMNKVCNSHHGYSRDSDLHRNDSEIREMKFSGGGELKTTTLKNTFQGDETEDQSKISTKVLSIIDDKNGETLKSPFEFSSLCKVADAQSDQSCNIQGKHTLEDVHQSHDYNRYENCRLASNEGSNVAYEVGTYNLRDQANVSALRQVTQTNGMIECDGRTVGHGHMTTDEVFTTRVMSVGQLVGCKGSEVYSGYTFRLDSGVVVSSSSSATIGASIR